MYVYGAGGHGNVVREILEGNGVEVIALLDDDSCAKHPKSAFSNDFDLPNLDAPIVIGVGDNSDRRDIAQLCKPLFGTAVHESAIISPSSEIGAGTVVLQGAIIQARSQIGEHVLINTGASVDHDNVIGSFAHISPRVALCGHVEVGEGAHVGVGAVAIPRVKIGKWAVVGAGTVLIEDVPDYAVVVGNPAKILRIDEPCG